MGKIKANTKQNNTIENLIDKLVPPHVTEWQHNLMFDTYNSSQLAKMKDFFSYKINSIEEVLSVYENVWIQTELDK